MAFKFIPAKGPGTALNDTQLPSIANPRPLPK
jgi:hypothetical protein